MQENISKSKHILFKFQTIEELIQGVGYKPSLKAMTLISPNMTIDELIKRLLEINEISLACEVMVYALHPRARIWWGCSIIKSLHEELFAKANGKEGAKLEGETEETAEAAAPKEKAEAVTLPKNKEEANEMLSQKVDEQKEALGLSKDKKQSDKSSNASSDNSSSSASPSSGNSEKQELTPEEKKQLLEKLKAQQEKQQAEQKARFAKEIEMAEKKNQEALKKIDETIAGLSPEDKAFYDELQKKIDQYFKENIGMTKQEYIDFANNLIKKAGKADESGDPDEKQAVLREFATVLSKNSDSIAKKFDEIIEIQKEFEKKQTNNSSKNQSEAAPTEEKAKAEEKPEIDVAALIKEKEEAKKTEKIKEAEDNAAYLENNLRKKAYEAAVSWVNEPTKPNTLNVEKYSKEASEYPEGMLCLASFWSYGDFSISSASQKNLQEERKETQPETIIRVDSSLPAKGIYSTLLMSALHEGGTRKPVDRFVLYYRMGEKIACGDDNWTDKKEVEPNPEQPLPVPQKSKENLDNKPIDKPKKPADKPIYKRWKL